MEEKWKNQAEQGTEIHNVLQRLFSMTGKAGKQKLWTEILSDPQTGAMQKKNFIDWFFAKNN
jgi:hypothetical protein